MDPDEPTIGDVLLAIANLETRLNQRMTDIEAAISRMAQNVSTVAVLFASHLDDHHRGVA